MVHYTYRAEWSPEAGHYVGSCMEFPWLSREGPTASDAIAAVQERVDELVDGILARDEELPPSLTERHYSGKFVVRTSTALHARLTVEAIEQGVSLNQWIVQKLSGRRPEPDDF
jgi:predicted HicB family RNase H-like nuclease